MNTPPIKLIMTLLVKDEADCIRENIRYHLSAGVDFIIAIDNGSTDGTRDILRDYERGGVLSLTDEPGDNYAQAVWVTRAALRAREEFGADWVLNNDADEFWVSPNGDLKSHLRHTDANILSCRRKNMIFSKDDSSTQHWIDKAIHRVEHPYPLPPGPRSILHKFPYPFYYYHLKNKALVRTKNLVSISQGNHNAAFTGEKIVKQSDIEIYHYPIRARSQFEAKILSGGLAYSKNKKLPKMVGWTWRRWYQMMKEHGMDYVMNDILPSEQRFLKDLSDGLIIEDRDFQSQFSH